MNVFKNSEIGKTEEKTIDFWVVFRVCLPDGPHSSGNLERGNFHAQTQHLWLRRV